MIGSALVRKLFRRPQMITLGTPCRCGHERREHTYISEHFTAVCVHARKGGACTCSRFEAA